MRYLLVFSIAVFTLTSAFAQSGNRGDPTHGRTIADTWCSACHLVSSGAAGAVNADVPTFISIAQRLPTDADVLAGFIANPHPPMPNLGLSRQDIRDVLEYIATLK